MEELFLDEIKNIPIKVNQENTKILIQEKEKLLYELESINSHLQKEYEKYKKEELSKEGYLQRKQKLLLKKQKLVRELEQDNNSTDANEMSNSPDDGKITKEYVEAMLEKIVVSRHGSIEIELKER